MFGDEPAFFVGEHYRLTGLDGTPKPLQRPHPPLMLGGGKRSILSLAVREADIVSVHVNFTQGRPIPERPDATLAATLAKLEWIREAACTTRSQARAPNGALRSLADRCPASRG
jgi:alkanesulfonate monooxygenase SsuD/methylene tetrahydromethanopterin reductase-like flavin-dependent oxidoreductase (luciferase family)